MGIQTSTWSRSRQLIMVLVPSFVTCTKLSSALYAYRRPPSPGHFPLSTTPHLPTPLTTPPFLLPSVPPQTQRPEKYFRFRYQSPSLPPFLFSITTSNTCVSAQRTVVCLISTSFLGHEATLIKLLLIAPEFNLFNSQPSFSNAPPPQVQVRTS